MTPERLAQLRSDYRDHGYMLEVLADLDTVTAERDELAATIANERGEGEPPAGWTPDPSRGGAWGWVRVAGGRVLDADFVTGTSYEGPPFRGWDWRVVDVAGTGRVVARGRCDTARAAMRAADAAVPTTTAPEAPR